MGNQEQLRNCVSVRSRGQGAQFLTLLEPFENKRLVKNATASGPGILRIELADGRVQELKISGLAGETSGVKVNIKETTKGSMIRTEETAGPSATIE